MKTMYRLQVTRQTRSLPTGHTVSMRHVAYFDTVADASRAWSLLEGVLYCLKECAWHQITEVLVPEVKLEEVVK